MNRILLTIILLLGLSVPTFAQSESLINGSVEHGGYGVITVKLTQIGGEQAILFGGYGGWLINHKLLIGAGAYGLASDVKAPAAVQNLENSL